MSTPKTLSLRPLRAAPAPRRSALFAARFDALARLSDTLRFGTLRRSLVELAGLAAREKGDAAVLEPYLLEVLERVREADEDWTLVGQDPTTLAPLLALIDRFEVDHPGMLDVTRRVRRAVALQYRLGGDELQAGRVLRLGPAQPTGRESVVETGTHRDFGWVEERARAVPDEGSCLVPLVEQPLWHEGPALGAVSALRARVVARAEERDELFVEIGVASRSAREDFADRIVEAVRTLLRRSYPRLAGRYYVLKLSFESDDMFAEVRSAGLGAAMMVLDRILAFEGMPAPAENALAVTGDLERNGRVRPVDGPTLALKVEAVFFSPARRLVAPRSQVGAVERWLRESGWRGRTLEVVGVSSLAEAWRRREDAGP